MQSYLHSRGAILLHHSLHTQTFQANSRSIDFHLGGGALGNLGIFFAVAYAVIVPTVPWIYPAFIRQEPAAIDNVTVAPIGAESHT